MTGHDYSSGNVEKLAPASQLQRGMRFHTVFYLHHKSERETIYYQPQRSPK